MNSPHIWLAGSKRVGGALRGLGAETIDQATEPLVRGRSVVVAPSATKRDYRASAERDAERALRMGAAAAGYIAKPPIGIDVADYIVEANGHASLERLLDCVIWMEQPSARTTSEPALPSGETAFDLVEREMPDPKKLCDPWGIEGLNLIASRPKLGKTTLLRHKSAAMSDGSEFLGAKCQQTRVAFLSLEEGPRVMRAKFRRGGFSETALAGITLFYEWPRGVEGVALLARWLSAHPDVSYVVIDSLTRFRDVPDVRTPAFVADYEAMNRLHDLTNSRPGLVLDVIHHTRKAKGDDPIDDISGTYGLTAACDSYVVLRRSNDGATMHVGGRLWDRDESDYELRRADQRWHLVGASDGLTEGERFTLKVVAEGGGMGASALANILQCTRQNAYKRLDALFFKGKIRKEGKLYVVS